MQSISPADAKTIVETNGALLFDIRSEKEFNDCHLPGAVLIPDGRIDRNLSRMIGGKKAIFYCTSGARTERVAPQIENAGFSTADVIAGGLNAWMQSGLPTVKAPGNQCRISIQRQVQLTVGLMLMISAICALAGFTTAVYATLAISAGLVFAGLTGTCALARILMMLPWNQQNPV